MPTGMSLSLIGILSEILDNDAIFPLPNIQTIKLEIRNTTKAVFKTSLGINPIAQYPFDASDEKQVSKPRPEII